MRGLLLKTLIDKNNLRFNVSSYSIDYFLENFGVIKTEETIKIPDFNAYITLRDPSPSQYAIIKNKPEALKVIINKLENKNVHPKLIISPYNCSDFSDDYRSPILTKIDLLNLSIMTKSRKCFDVILSFLKKHFDIYKPIDEISPTPLYTAIYYNFVEVIPNLIEEPLISTLETTKEHYTSPFLLAVQKYNTEEKIRPIMETIFDIFSNHVELIRPILESYSKKKFNDRYEVEDDGNKGFTELWTSNGLQFYHKIIQEEEKEIKSTNTANINKSLLEKLYETINKEKTSENHDTNIQILQWIEEKLKDPFNDRIFQNMILMNEQNYTVNQNTGEQNTIAQKIIGSLKHISTIIIEKSNDISESDDQCLKTIIHCFNIAKMVFRQEQNSNNLKKFIQNLTELTKKFVESFEYYEEPTNYDAPSNIENHIQKCHQCGRTDVSLIVLGGLFVCEECFENIQLYYE
ncbi:hypothetical protein TRFO_30099 [Tritrichomonas foetus]|uniref:Uncharacterized protein n=1 Tax=Tritrichomonas foetus TaxID=1144522 RepID=A0A1J4JUB7_9EUKA|nr:hypothetical protein TRFO_30099 [Tritrichomonas foetus]|eukprot:OHT02729.1 hypothetical protein TRFO_30099 [Tritrichomonas foetus]